MVFNSLEFLYFFGVFVILYWLFREKMLIQNVLVVLGSYYFYAFIDLKLPLLLFITTSFVFGISKFISSFKNKYLYFFSVLFLVCQLGFLKYFHSGNSIFFSLTSTIGISYFSLVAYSYLNDVYHARIQPTRNFIAMLAYFSFFPSILSGPIFISHLHFSQFERLKTINWTNVPSALIGILWGLFKKVVLSGALGLQVNYIFFHYETLGAGYLWMGIFLYSFQVYADFSGYSDMSYGISRLLGVETINNFNTPFFSKSIVEFWRRWHISLNIWLKVYLYLPLKELSIFKNKQLLLAFIIFAISGLWHGASFNFVLWGMFNGLLYVLAIWLSKSGFREINGILKTIFVFVSIASTRVLFHTKNMSEAVLYYQKMFSLDNFTIPEISNEICFLLVFCVLIELNQVHNYIDFSLEKLVSIKGLFYVLILLTVTVYFWPSVNSTEYIYFKF